MTTIHVYLLDEGTDCWVAVNGEHVAGNKYRISDVAPGDQLWEFGNGDLVRCRVQMLSAGTAAQEGLVAFERAEEA